MAKNWSADDEGFLADRFDDMMMREELAGRYEANIRTISDTLEHLALQSGKKRGGKESPEDPFKTYGYVVRTFVVENLGALDYRDIASLVGVPADDLKDAIERAGIPLEGEKIGRWENITTGEYKYAEDCARCDVQLRHSIFSVGHRNCAKCLEENIRLWVNSGHPIRISLRDFD